MKRLNVTFCSFPDFSGNAKALYEYMEKKYGNSINFIWAVSKKKNLERLKKMNINAYLIGTGEYFKKMKKTNIFFSTHCNITGEKNKKSLYIELWHGISPKKVGYMVNNITKEDADWYERLSAEVDYIIVPSSFWQPIFASRFYLNINQVLPLGYPKLDFLANKEAKNNLQKLIDINIKEYKKIIFYTPTFRKGCGRLNDSSFNDNILNLIQYDEKILINFLKKNKYLLCIKKHPSEETDFLEKTNCIDNVKLISDEQLSINDMDIYSILDAADLLITDYSSLGIEFLFLDKPVVYLNTDIKKYNQNRGINFENFNFWSSNTAIDSIDELLDKFDLYLNKNSVPNFLREKKSLWFSNLNDGGCENICNYFFTESGKLRNIDRVINDSQKYRGLKKKYKKLNTKALKLNEELCGYKRTLNNILNSKSWKLIERARRVMRR